MTRYGDFIICNNCGFKGLIPFGKEDCPNCKATGTMSWVHDDKQESSLEEVKQEMKADMERACKTSPNGFTTIPVWHFPKGTPIKTIKQYFNITYC